MKQDFEMLVVYHFLYYFVCHTSTAFLERFDVLSWNLIKRFTVLQVLGAKIGVLYSVQICYVFATRQCQRRHYVLGCRVIPSVHWFIYFSICAHRYFYHDISWTAWTVLIKLTRNIHYPLITNLLDSAGLSSRSCLGSSMWWLRHPRWCWAVKNKVPSSSFSEQRQNFCKYLGDFDTVRRSITDYVRKWKLWWHSSDIRAMEHLKHSNFVRFSGELCLNGCVDWTGYRIWAHLAWVYSPEPYWNLGLCDFCFFLLHD